MHYSFHAPIALRSDLTVVTANINKHNNWSLLTKLLQFEGGNGKTQTQILFNLSKSGAFFSHSLLKHYHLLVFQRIAHFTNWLQVEMKQAKTNNFEMNLSLYNKVVSLSLWSNTSFQHNIGLTDSGSL